MENRSFEGLSSDALFVVPVYIDWISAFENEEVRLACMESCRRSQRYSDYCLEHLEGLRV